MIVKSAAPETTKSTAPVRGTQSFVYTLSSCWKRPSLTLLEVLWRWAFGIPALALLAWQAQRILAATPLDTAALERMSFTDPMAAAETFSREAIRLWPPVLHAAFWIVPLLFIAWIVLSAFGRTAVLRRADPTLHARPWTLAALHALRFIALAGSFALWWLCLRAAGDFAVNSPIEAGQEPNLVLYSAIAIVTTLGLFALWAIASWWLAIAPLLAMRRDLNASRSLVETFRLGPVRGKLIEINLVMGIVKIALIVLALVASACPLPFEAIATPEFMTWWYLGVSVLYFVASDFFHIVHLVSYLELWRLSEQ